MTTPFPNTPNASNAPDAPGVGLSGGGSPNAGATPYRVGLVGLGTIAEYYLAALERVPGWELVAACDLRPQVLRPLRDRAAAFRDHRDMLAESTLDCVIVTAPNDAHASVCRDALDAGLAVCVEKPLALGLEQGRDLMARVSGAATLFTAFHRRYNDNVHRLLRAARERGGIESLAVRYLERIEEHIGGDTWYLDSARCGGGCVADNGPNAFDLVRLFLGEVRVERTSITRDEHGVDRRASVRLRSEEGIPALVELDWSHPGETKDVEVRFGDGSTGHADMLAGFDGFKSSLWHEYRAMLRAFGEAIEDSDRRDGGLPALELVTQAYGHEQARSSERVGIRVPETERES